MTYNYDSEATAEVLKDLNEVLAALNRVADLLLRWENAIETGTGNQSIVAQAFALELRKAIAGES